MLLTLISFILILSLLIFVHELGHFVVAKWSKITVEEFAIGFPPRAVKLWQGEGRITLDGHEFQIPRTVTVARQIQPGAQVYAETGIDEQSRPMVTKLEFIEPPQPQPEGTPPQTADPQKPTVMVESLVRPTEYCLNFVPFGGYVRMLGEEDPRDPGSFASKSKRIRLAVLVAGSAMNLLTAMVFFTFTAMSSVPETQTMIEEVLPDTPAAQAGLQKGDIIIGADNVIEFKRAGELVTYVGQKQGQEIALNLKRGNQTLTIPVKPRLNPPPGQGSIGIKLSFQRNGNLISSPYSLFEAVGLGVQNTFSAAVTPFFVLRAYLSNQLPPEMKDSVRPTGLVGIYQQTGEAVSFSVTNNWWFPVLSWIAFLSTALAVTNLLPFPALDGGRMLFIFIEAIRGKRVSPEKEGVVHFFGLVMLLSLMLVITFYDIRDPLPTIDWNSIFN